MRVKIEHPTPPGENKVSLMEHIPIPEGYSEIVYVVHPSTIDGDRKFKVQNATQEYVNSNTKGKRSVLIAPPQGCVYLKAGTQVTDVRSGASEFTWVRDDDIEEQVTEVTLVGGNLEKCLGSVCRSVYLSAKKANEGKTPRKEIKINLPLSAIYTTLGISAEDVLNLLRSKGKVSELEAIVALLTSTDYQNYQYNRDFEIIFSEANRNYRISANGKQLGTLSTNPETELKEYPTIPGYPRIIFSHDASLNLDMICDINIIYVNNINKEIDYGDSYLLSGEYRDEWIDSKTRHAKKVLEKYVIS